MARVGQILVFIFLAFLSCKNDAKREIKTESISFTKEGELAIIATETDTIKANFDIEIAENEYETQTGLMYRKSMKKDRGMLFIQPIESLQYFYINMGMKIVSFQKNAQPFNENSLPSNVPAKYVLEINAGLSDQLGLQVGDSISFSRN